MRQPRECRRNLFIWVWAIVVLAAVAPAGAMSAAEEARLGKQVFAEVRPMGLTSDPALRAIGERLAKTMQRKEVPWSFWVVEGMKEYNAFAAPGGYVFISRPYFAKLNANEAAFVIGHEMSHIDLNHHERQMKRNQRANLGNLLLRVLTNSSAVATAADIGATAYVTRYSRVLEREADFAGYRRAEQAGYDAEAAVSALSKLGEDKKVHPWIQNVYATHPVLSSREDRLTALGGKEPDDDAPPPPPAPEHSLAAGLKPFDPAVPIAVRVLQPEGKRWEHSWRKSFTKLLHLRLTPLGFKIAGDDLMYKADIGDPIEAARNREAKYLLLVTVKELGSEVAGKGTETGTPVKAAVEITARVLNVDTGAEVWSGQFAEKAEGADVLPSDPETLYLDTTVGGLAWKAAGEMAGGASALLCRSNQRCPLPPGAALRGIDPSLRSG